jgi:hypothetical protein
MTCLPNISRSPAPRFSRHTPVELTVHDDARAANLARDGLVACREVDDAEPCMAECDPFVLRYPVTPSVGPAMEQPLRCELQHCLRNGMTTRKGDVADVGAFALWAADTKQERTH